MSLFCTLSENPEEKFFACVGWIVLGFHHLAKGGTFTFTNVSFSCKIVANIICRTERYHGTKI